jgi:molybdate transport system ATP-binding protein
MSGAGVAVMLHGQIGGFSLDLSFAAPGTGVTALFGPSGAGKSTILRAIAGLTRLARARIACAGETWQDETMFLPPHRRPVGMVFQDANLFAHLSVADNLRFGLKRVGVGSESLGFDAVVAMLGLENLLPRDPATLSGGERQRVAIGRALLVQPRLLLVDEPLSAVDQSARESILTMLERLCGTLAIPVIYVSHDLAEVSRLADHLILIEQGRAIAAGAIATILADLDLPLAAHAHAGVVLDAMVGGYDAAYGLLRYEVAGAILVSPGPAAPVGSRARVRVLASDVSLCRTPPHGTTMLNTPHGVIVGVDHLDGFQTNVLLRLGETEDGARVIARITRKSWDHLGFQPGETVHALIKGVGLLSAR